MEDELIDVTLTLTGVGNKGFKHEANDKFFGFTYAEYVQFENWLLEKGKELNQLGLEGKKGPKK